MENARLSLGPVLVLVELPLLRLLNAGHPSELTILMYSKSSQEDRVTNHSSVRPRHADSM
jgi:hypothetical protein